MLKLLISASLLSLSQPALAEPTVPNVIDEQMAQSCKFMGMVNSVRIGTSVSKAFNGALEGAMQKAIKKGANAIVVKSSTPQGSFMTVLASAYDCQSTQTN